jgi:hypothetical protein
VWHIAIYLHHNFFVISLGKFNVLSCGSLLHSFSVRIFCWCRPLFVNIICYLNSAFKPNNWIILRVIRFLDSISGDVVFLRIWAYSVWINFERGRHLHGFDEAWFGLRLSHALKLKRTLVPFLGLNSHF